MPATVLPLADPVTGDRKHVADQAEVLATVTGDSSYTSGGYAVTPQQFGFFDRIDYIVPLSSNGAAIIQYDRANKKIKIFTALGTEAAGGSNQSAIVADVLAVGK